MQPRIRTGTRAIGREEGLTCVTPGWRNLVGRAYDHIEATPGVNACWVSQRQGLLWVEVTPRPAPAHLLWHLAAIERLSARICQVCGLRGRPCDPSAPVHWLVDNVRVLCRYHAACRQSGIELDQMIDERLAVLAYAAEDVRPLLAGDLATLTPAEYRRQLGWASEAVPAKDADGFVFASRVAWVLDQASAAQLGACTPSDLEPFFGWEEAPEVREAAMCALARLSLMPARATADR